MSKILLVDRRSYILPFLRGLLEIDPSLNVSSYAGTAGEALLALSVEDVDLVITDLGSAGHAVLGGRRWSKDRAAGELSGNTRRRAEAVGISSKSSAATRGE